MYTVLYVDDEPGLLEIGKLFLEEDGQFIVDTISSATDALALLDTKVYDAIISDYHMPVMDGVEFLKKVRTSGNTIPFILFTGGAGRNCHPGLKRRGRFLSPERRGAGISVHRTFAPDRPCRETETG